MHPRNKTNKGQRRPDRRREEQYDPGWAPEPDPPAPAPAPMANPRFERAFCSLVSYERPRRLLDMLKEQEEVLTCDCKRYFELAEVRFTPEHPHFRQAARCAAILVGEAAPDIGCVSMAPGDDGTIEVSVAIRGSRRWNSTTATDPERLAAAWLEARGDD